MVRGWEKRIESTIPMFQFDYLGEKIIEYNGVQYTIYRTYNRSVDEIELYTELKKGNDGKTENDQAG